MERRGPEHEGLRRGLVELLATADLLRLSDIALHLDAALTLLDPEAAVNAAHACGLLPIEK